MNKYNVSKYIIYICLSNKFQAQAFNEFLPQGQGFDLFDFTYVLGQ